MSQAQPLPEEEKTNSSNINNIQETSTTTMPNPAFKLNAQAPEFVPRSHTTTTTTQMPPISGYFYPFFQILGGAGASDWFYVGDQDPSSCLISANNVGLATCSKNVLTHDLQQKIVKQVRSLSLSSTCSKNWFRCFGFLRWVFTRGNPVWASSLDFVLFCSWIIFVVNHLHLHIEIKTAYGLWLFLCCHSGRVLIL